MKQNKNHMTRKNKKRRIVNILSTCFLACVILGGAFLLFALSSIMKDAPSLNSSMFNSDASTPIMDINGKLYAEVGKENRENITYEQLPQTLIDAFIAIEDSRFFTHNGFDLPRFAKSALNNLKSGALSQGGSTLTMQMVDNVRKDNPEYNEAEASKWQRIIWKIQEIILSMGVENTLTKKDIITKYLNKVNFGYTARGIQKGAQYYFGKDVSQLNLSESAFLAGVVNAPNLFNPYRGTQWSQSKEDWINFYKDYAVKRRDDTLYQMLNHGYISKDEYQLAKNTELAFQLQGERFFTSESSQAYVKMVEDEALKKYGINIHETPCIVYTALDPDAQALADRISSGESFTISGTSALNMPQNSNYNIAFTLMDAKTGGITAISPGRNFDPNAEAPYNINQATNTRSPGSTIKPIMEYAPSFDHLGYATSHTFQDIPIEPYGNGVILRNSDGKYRGDVLYKDAVAHSYNTMAIGTLNELINSWGTANIKKYLSDLGFSKSVVDSFVPQYAIGGANMVASPLTIAGAYGMLANQGQYIEPHTIVKIEFPDDPSKDTIHAEPKKTNPISPQAAYLMSDVLNYAVNNNFFMRQVWPQAGYPVYGKTGTSGWDEAGAQYGFSPTDIREEWMVNYTSDYVIATWTGHTQPGVIDNQLLNANIPGKINRLMLDLMATKKAPIAIANPGGISNISHVKGKFPYAAPQEGMDNSMIVNGMIKSNFAKLQILEADNLQNLDSFSANLDTNNQLQLSFNPYPDAMKLQDPSIQKNYNILGISFVGASFYDPGFIFGKVVYKADIKQNGSILQTITTSDNNSIHSLNNLSSSSPIQVCGYYGYSISNKRSNEICTTLQPNGNSNNLNKHQLEVLISIAQTYLDPSKYTQESISRLSAAISKAQNTLKSANNQNDINNEIKQLQKAIDYCKENELN